MEELRLAALRGALRSGGRASPVRHGVAAGHPAPPVTHTVGDHSRMMGVEATALTPSGVATLLPLASPGEHSQDDGEPSVERRCSVTPWNDTDKYLKVVL